MERIIKGDTGFALFTSKNTLGNLKVVCCLPCRHKLLRSQVRERTADLKHVPIQTFFDKKGGVL